MIVTFKSVPKDKLAKAWAWCKSHLDESWVARHGNKCCVAIRNGATGQTARVAYYSRLPVSARCKVAAGELYWCITL